MQEFINESKRFLLDYKLNRIDGKYNITIDNPLPTSYWFSKKKRLLKQLYALDGVLTGSSALSLYRLNGKPIFGRKPNDFDILLSKSNFYKFCGMNNFTDIKHGQDVISLDLKKGYRLFTTGYGRGNEDGIKFGYDIDIIGKDELPPFVIVNGVRVSTLESVIEFKLDMILSKYPELNGSRPSVPYPINRSEYCEKHVKDINNVMSKIEAYK